MKIELRKVTPKMAEAWLKKNHVNNRTISWSVVAAIANDIETGNWRVTHQGICFDGKGNLIDGQHRLHAIVKAGKTVEILVIENEGSEITDPIDRNRSRSLNYLTGYHNRVLSAMKVLRGLEAGFPYLTPMTPAEAQATFGRHQEAYEALKGTTGTKLFGGVLGMAIWAFPLSPTIVDFTAQVVRGESIKRGDPSYALRNWLQHNKGALQPWESAMATANCITHFLTNQTLSGVYSGQSGYRYITTKRRVLKIPNTPSNELVPTLTKPSRKDE
jgi:hypothetical protein